MAKTSLRLSRELIAIIGIGLTVVGCASPPVRPETPATSNSINGRSTYRFTHDLDFIPSKGFALEDDFEAGLRDSRLFKEGAIWNSSRRRLSSRSGPTL